VGLHVDDISIPITLHTITLKTSPLEKKKKKKVTEEGVSIKKVCFLRGLIHSFTCLQASHIYKVDVSFGIAYTE